MHTDSFRRTDVLINRSESFRRRRSTSLAACLSACRARMYSISATNASITTSLSLCWSLIIERCGPARYHITRFDFSPIKWMTVKLVRLRARRYTTAYMFGSLIWYLAFDLPVRIGDATIKWHRNCRHWNGTYHSGQQPNYSATKSYPQSSINHEKQMYVY